MPNQDGGSPKKSSERWDPNSIGDLTGRQAVVTGANSGLGFFTTVALASAGADVTMACRDPKRAQQALADVQRELQQASTSAGPQPGTVTVQRLDLSDLASVEQFATDITGDLPRIDILVNNAGIMACPRATSAQGFELQMATNHLGHYALTARLWPLLAAAPAARVVSLSSLAARQGKLKAAMTRETLIDPTPYSAWGVYCNTKQATLLFSQELARRAGAAGSSVVSVAAHPGVSNTELFKRQLTDRHLGFAVPVVSVFGSVAFSSAQAGAQPQIRAAADPTLAPGSFVGPTGPGQFRGAPNVIGVFSTGRSEAAAAKLWELSADIVEVTIPV